MRPKAGMTLLEVLVAVVIIAVGVLAAAAMQTGSLRASSQARVAARLTEAAQGEVEVQRQIARAGQATETQNCVTLMPPGIASCRVTLIPCSFVTDPVHAKRRNVSCSGVTVGRSQLIAHYATVTLSASNRASFSLGTLVRRND